MFMDAADFNTDGKLQLSEYLRVVVCEGWTVTFDTEEDVKAAVDAICASIDSDNSGSVTEQELRVWLAAVDTEGPKLPENVDMSDIPEDIKALLGGPVEGFKEFVAQVAKMD